MYGWMLSGKWDGKLRVIVGKGGVFAHGWKIFICVYLYRCRCGCAFVCLFVLPVYVFDLPVCVFETLIVVFDIPVCIWHTCVFS